MLARPGGMPPPELVPDDPGPWSIVAQLRRERARAARPDKRRKPPPHGLLLSRPPQLAVPTPGLLADGPVTGVAKMRLVAAAREPAWRLWFEEEQQMLLGVSPLVHRSWSLPGLRPDPERRTGEDPAADIPPPLEQSELAEGELRGAVIAPGGEYAAVPVRDGPAVALAFLRLEDRAVVRWVVGARAAAWSSDGRMLAIGGQYGVLLGVPLQQSGS